MKSDRETGFCCQGRMSGYYSKKVAAPTPKGITFLEKYLETLARRAKMLASLTGAAQLPL